MGSLRNEIDLIAILEKSQNQSFFAINCLIVYHIQKYQRENL